MIFILISFLAGILFGIPTAKYVTPPSVQILLILMSPWVILLAFSNHPLINDLRGIYLSWVIGICCYWTYFEMDKKIKGR